MSISWIILLILFGLWLTKSKSGSISESKDNQTSGDGFKPGVKSVISICLIGGLIWNVYVNSNSNRSKRSKTDYSKSYRYAQKYDYERCDDQCFKHRKMDSDYYCEHEKLWDKAEETRLRNDELNR